MPSFISYSLFLVYPLIKASIISFCRYESREFIYVGLRNYFYLLQDPIFKRAIINTCFFTIGSVPIVLAFAILIASFIVNKPPKVRNFFMGLFYLPTITSVVTICLSWQWIYSMKNGILNIALETAGFGAVNWLGNQQTALISVMVVLIYCIVGQPIILYTIAIGNIPKSLYEVADIEGATNFQKLWHITLPLIKPTTLFLTVILTIGSFQAFILVKLMTGGGPFYRTTTIAYQLVEDAFTFAQYGIASAMGIVLLCIVGLFTMLQFKLISSNIEY